MTENKDSISLDYYKELLLYDIPDNTNLEIQEKIRSIGGAVQTLVSSIDNIYRNISKARKPRNLAYAMIHLDDTIMLLNRINQEFREALLKELTND